MRALAILCVLAAIARGEPNPAAARLFDEGRLAAKAGNYTEACAKFTRALELDPAATGTELNLADCVEHLGNPSRAWKLFDDVAKKSESEFPARAKLARDRADLLAPKLALVVLQVAEPTPDLVVTIAGKPVVTAAEIRERVEPGQLAIEAALPGKPRFTRTVDVAAGATVTIEIPAIGVAATVTQPALGARQRSRVYLAAGVGGVGVAGVIVSIVLGIDARLSYQNQINNNGCTGSAVLTCTPAGAAAVASAGHEADVATIFVLGGAVLAALGATLYFTAPRDITVTPTASATGIGLSLAARF